MEDSNRRRKSYERIFWSKSLYLALAAVLIVLSGYGKDAGQNRENPSGTTEI